MATFAKIINLGILAPAVVLLAATLALAVETPHSTDQTLIRSLLQEGLATRTFPFPIVIEAATGKKVLPLDPRDDAHQRVRNAIESALQKSVATLNQPNSPIRKLRRINEASRFFEDELLLHLNHTPGLACEIPKNKSGNAQRSGYPDLRITDQASGQIFYLDPKLVEAGSETSSFRTFYYEPRTHTGKILDDAVHLLVGIQHDGKNQQWTFTGWHLVDLSTIHLRLKAEFQTSNAELYQKSTLSTPSATQ